MSLKWWALNFASISKCIHFEFWAKFLLLCCRKLCYRMTKVELSSDLLEHLYSIASRSFENECFVSMLANLIEWFKFLFFFLFFLFLKKFMGHLRAKNVVSCALGSPLLWHKMSVTKAMEIFRTIKIANHKWWACIFLVFAAILIPIN